MKSYQADSEDESSDIYFLINAYSVSRQSRVLMLVTKRRTAYSVWSKDKTGVGGCGLVFFVFFFLIIFVFS